MATKLLLLEDVEDLGRSGDIVSVKPGYGRNFLLPQQKAVVATKGTLRMQAKLQEERLKRAAEEKKQAEKLAERFVDFSIETIVKVDPEGHLYGSVTVVDIVDMLEKQLGMTVEKKCILLKHPIKVLGEHTIELKLHEEVPATFLLKVLAEEAAEAAAAKAEEPTA